MRTSLLLITMVLLAACSDDSPPPPQSTTQSPAPVAQAPAGQTAPTDKADIAAVEVTDPEQEKVADPCDLRGYDMSKMTVELHESLVEACNRSKQ